MSPGMGRVRSGEEERELKVRHLLAPGGRGRGHAARTQEFSEAGEGKSTSPWDLLMELPTLPSP